MSHFAACTHARVRDGVPELLVISYREAVAEGSKRHTKFAGGMNEDDEVLSETAVREAIEELGGDDFSVYSVNEVFRWDHRDHTKGFFAIEYDGELRTEEMIEDDGTLLDPPRYEKVSELLASSDLVFSHRLALEEFVLHYSQSFQEFSWVAWDLDPRMAGRAPVLC